MASGPSGIQGGGLLDFLSVLLGFFCAATNDDSFLPSAPLPEILCCWANKLCDLSDHKIKHLAEHIREGNWASHQNARRASLEAIPCTRRPNYLLRIYRHLGRGRPRTSPERAVCHVPPYYGAGTTV